MGVQPQWIEGASLYDICALFRAYHGVPQYVSDDDFDGLLDTLRSLNIPDIQV